MSDDEGGRRGRRGLGGGWSASSDDDLGGTKKRKRQNDDPVLGIFGQPPKQKKGGKGGGKGDEGVSRRPVAFVKGETMKPVEVPPPKTANVSTKEGDDDGSSSDNNEVDPRFRFEGAPNAPPAKEEGPKLPSKNKMSFGQMATNYGKGFAMLQKMGFTGGGLGRHNDGIANPIEVHRRQAGQGLQDEGEKVGQDLFGTETDVKTLEELLAPKAKAKAAAEQASQGWKKNSSSHRPKVSYKTAAEVAAEKPQTMRIVDMRGPEVKVASSFNELAQSLSNDAINSLKEMRHNTRKLVARYEEKIRTNADRQKYYENILLSASTEQERIQAAESLGVRGTRSCRELAQELQQLHERLTAGEISLREMGTSINKILDERPKEFQALGALDVALSLAAPAASTSLAKWKPLVAPEEGLKELAPWVKLCASLPGANSKASRRGGLNDAGSSFLRRLSDIALLPRLRAAIVEWEPRQFEAGLRLVESCRKLLSTEIADEVAIQVVLPRLRSQVDSWDPRVDRTAPHSWIHPWLDILGRRLEVLWAPIRFKLSTSLDRWHPSDPSAFSLLRPWQQVFDMANWEPLMEKVLSRLDRSLADMPIKPDGQDLEPVKNLLAWRGVLPDDAIARVLDHSFFPSWHQALRSWLRMPTCVFDEVLEWYGGWKAELQVLREEGSIQKQFAQALEVMKATMAAGGVGAAAEENVVDSDSEMEAAEASMPGRSNSFGGAAPAPVASEEVTLSLTDYLAEIAGEEGLVFKPKKMPHNGKQVYQFGSASLYVERSEVYVAPKAASGGEVGGPWRPVSMDELLKLGKLAMPKKVGKA